MASHQVELGRRRAGRGGWVTAAWALVGSLRLACSAAPAEAQHRPSSAIAPRIATLASWADDAWLALTDRDGSYFGRLDERGTLQRFNPLMDSEYELDLATALFAPAEDARWAGTERGIRVAGASINHPFVLNFIDWRERIPISGPVRLLARYVRQRSLTAQRDYSNVGFEWQPAENQEWRVRTTIGVHFFKASADLEVGTSRRWGHGEQSFTLDVGVAALDAFNNVIFNALGVRPEDTPAHFNYTTLPVAMRLAAVWQLPRGQVELRGGLSNRSEVLVSFPASGDPSFELAETFAFAGAMAAVRPAEAIAVAVYGTIARAEAVRSLRGVPREGLQVDEETRVAGLRARIGEGQRLWLELDLRSLWRPETWVVENDPPIDHRDREVSAQLAAAHWPPAGWIWRLGYGFMDRHAGVLAPWLSAANHREVIEVGHRFPSGFEVVAGLRWDLDQLTRAPFDGGQLRFAATW